MGDVIDPSIPNYDAEAEHFRKARKKIRRFRVNRRVDGATGITVEIVLSGSEPLMRVRLKHRRSAVEVPLGDVAEWILFREAKAKAAEKARLKKARKR